MCEHAAIKDNLSDYPLLKNLMPEDYIGLCHVCTFESLGDNFKAHLKLKLSREDEVQKWQEDFQASSCLTWRKSKTYPDVGHGSNKYRVDLRCQHNTRNTNKTGKNTCCPAYMYLILKRQTYSQGRKSRSEDGHIKEGYYFNVVLNNNHNHRITCAAALSKRDVSKETEGKLKKLFESGHSPASALDTIKYDLQEQVAVERAFQLEETFPHTPKASQRKLYHIIATGGVDFPEDWFQSLEIGHPLEATKGSLCSGATAEPPQPPQSQEEAAGCTIQESGRTEERLMEVKKELDDWVNELKKKLDEDPTYFKPVQSFLHSAAKLKTDSGVQSALCSYGKSQPTTKVRPRGFLQSRTTIGVQPTAVARRQTPLGGRRSVGAGRLPKSERKEHPYHRQGRAKGGAT